MITIESPGGQTLIQDRGRRGFRQLGIGWSGAFDQPAATLANSLVANDADAAVLEVLLGGLRFVTQAQVTMALTGAPTEVVVSTNDKVFRAPLNRRIEIPHGASVELGIPATDMRTYVSFSGGIDVEPVLGSRSSDTLGLLGPRPLEAGQTLCLMPRSSPFQNEPQTVNPTERQGVEPFKFGTTDLASSDLVAALAASGTALPNSEVGVPILEASPSSHAELVNGDFTELLGERVWTVGDKSSRIGIRLAGKPLPIDYPAIWASEPTLPGSIQIAPSGELIIFGPDGPTTGGYPVIAVASAAALARLSQLRPGSQLRLRISE